MVQRASAQHIDSGNIHNAAHHFLYFYEASENMQPVVTAIVLLLMSNVFMTFAWYAHLKELGGKTWFVAAIISWSIAFFEYMFQVPANRIGFTVLSVAQLKILQEVITLAVFVPFAVLYLKEPVKLDYVWAALCMLGAVYFVFRSKFGMG
ncbi:DMT family protein [Desulfovibrionales bacterium]